MVMARHAAPEQQKQPLVLAEDASYASASGGIEYPQRVGFDLVQEPRHVMGRTALDGVERVQAFRDSMRKLPQEQKIRLEAYIRQFYDDDNRPVGRHGSHIDWLADEHRGATPEEVLDWKERQTFELHAQQNDPEVQERIARVRELTAEKYAEYVDKGRLAKVGVLPDPVAAIKNTRVKVGDVRTTRIWGTRGYWPGDDQVVVAQGHAGTTEERIAGLLREIDETLPHELLHAAGLGGFLPSWAKEGMVEHVTDVFAHGDMDVLYPDSRNKASHIYLSQRRLLGTLQLNGAKEIDTAVVTRALSSSGYDSPEFRELDNQLDESWNEQGKFQRVCRQMAHVEHELRREYPDWHPMEIQARAAQRVGEELFRQGPTVRQQVHRLGRGAAGQHLTISIARGVASVSTQRTHS